MIKNLKIQNLRFDLYESIKKTKIVIFDMAIAICGELFFRCKVTEFVKKKPLIKRL